MIDVDFDPHEFIVDCHLGWKLTDFPAILPSNVRRVGR